MTRIVGGISLRSHVIHSMAAGRRFLVLHGDEFDGVIRNARWPALPGAWACRHVLMLNRWYNHWRRRFDQPYRFLSAYLKYKTKPAAPFIARFEEAVADEAGRHDDDGAICGHIHHAEVRTIGNIEYANSGDWVESCSAIVEEFDGRLEILRYVQIDRGTGRHRGEGDGGRSGEGDGGRSGEGGRRRSGEPAARDVDVSPSGSVLQ